MSLRLQIKQRGPSNGKASEVLLDQAVITLGRDKACQVVLPEQAVSRSHARITQDGPLYFIEDLGSAYGTEVNGKKLPKGEKRLLRPGDVIAIALFDLTFDQPPDPSVVSEKTSVVGQKMVKDMLKGLADDTAPYFRVMNGPREGERIEIPTAREMVLGRDESADWVFKDERISRRHVKIRRDWAGTHVEDLGSRNGIKVNKHRVTQKTLKDKDELDVGGLRFLYIDTAEVGEPVPEIEPAKPKPAPPIEPPAPERPEAAPAKEAEAAISPPPSAPMAALQNLVNAEPEEPPKRLGPLPSDPRSLLIIAAMAAFTVIALVTLVLVLAGA